MTPTAEKASTEVTKASPAQVQAAYAAIFDGEALAGYADPEAISRSIMERIQKADSFEEAFAPQTLTAWSDLTEVPVLVKSFHLNPTGFSGEAGGASVYAVCDLERLDSGEKVTVTCGGRNVLVQLVKMMENDWFSNPVKLTAKAAGEGRQVLWLVPAKA